MKFQMIFRKKYIDVFSCSLYKIHLFINDKISKLGTNRHFLSCMHLPNPSITDRMQHKVNFLAVYNWFEFKLFFFLDKFPNHG